MLLLCLFFTVESIRAAEMMLPKVYSQQLDVSGWVMSEKYDGVRGYWDGHQLLSKSGRKFYPPREFVQGLPPFPVEGELWLGRGTFEKTVSTVNKQYPHPGWLQLKFAIFDVPRSSQGFLDRIKKARQWFAEHPSPYAFVISQIPVTEDAHLQRELQRIEELGGEGLIVRKPDGLYKVGRSMEILKVKNYRDGEATVVAHLPGKGRNKGRLGALLVELADGTSFKVGTGFSDVERRYPPPVGTLVTFKFYGFYDSGIPKFPSYLRIRTDAGL